MKKSLANTLMLGAAALMGGLASSPSGQQVIDQQVNGGGNAQQVRTASQRVVNNNGQQQTARYGMRSYYNPYLPFGGFGYVGRSGGIPPKEYGEYLMRTGKDKQNARKRKHYAKMRA